MKKILLLLACAGGLVLPTTGWGQSFSMTHDTVTANVNGIGTVFDDVINNTMSPLTLTWHVTATDFPADWLTASAFGICDNNTCYNNGPDTHGHYTMQLWDSTTHIADNFTSAPYGDTTTSGTFDLSLNLNAATSSGCHYVTVALSVPGTIGGGKTVTFIICKAPLAVSQVAKSTENVVLYPNPTHDELNVVFDESNDVKTIAIYNIIGKVMSVYKVNGTSANMSVENMPAGIYFVRMSDSRGAVVATKRFTKQ